MRKRLIALSFATLAAVGSLTACSSTPNAIDTLKKAGYADVELMTRDASLKPGGPGRYKVFLNTEDRSCAGFVEFRADGTFVDQSSGIVGATPEQMRDHDTLLRECKITKP